MHEQEKKLLELFITHAYDLLSRRPQSEFEMRYKLKRYGNKRKILDCQIYINQVVELLRDEDYVNDRTFAKWYTDQRQQFKPRSKRQIQMELIKKGIEREIVAEALEQYDEELACRTLTLLKKHMKIDKLKNYLLRQGFGWDMIEQILN
jgi:regulatory protein